MIPMDSIEAHPCRARQVKRTLASDLNQNRKGTKCLRVEGHSFPNCFLYHFVTLSLRPAKYEDIDVNTRRTFSRGAATTIPNHAISSKK
mmetsp:Transcript_25967/g.72494  ORF Transcript_25967/g.72494 Transcript_25967/m.72494 type:complete len:89 (-) Transcript_25967:830-1096(-)